MTAPSVSPAPNRGSERPRRCLVTGASGGIGEAIALNLLGRGAEVTLVARAGERLEAARTRLGDKGAVKAVGCELSLQREVRRLAEAVAAERFDVVVLNAALMPGGRNVTAEGVEETLAVNHVAPYLLARLLVPTLAPEARVVVAGADPFMLRSEPVALDDLPFERNFSPTRAYMRTKNMNAMFAYALARRLAGTGVTVNAAHPGVIRTQLARNASGALGALLTLAKPFLPDAAAGADTPAWLAWSTELAGITGRFFVKRKPVATAPHTLDRAGQEELWDRSAALVGLPS